MKYIKHSTSLTVPATVKVRSRQGLRKRRSSMVNELALGAQAVTMTYNVKPSLSRHNTIPDQAHHSTQKDGQRHTQPKPIPTDIACSCHDDPPRVSAQTRSRRECLVHISDFPQPIDSGVDEPHRRGVDAAEAGLDPTPGTKCPPHTHGAVHGD